MMPTVVVMADREMTHRWWIWRQMVIVATLMVTVVVDDF